MLKRLNLRLFSEGGEGAGASTSAEGAAEVNINSVAIHGSEGGDEAFKQASPVTDGVSEGGKKVLTREEKKAKFDEMIRGEYKEFYQENFNNAFGKRFKDMKGNEEKLKSYDAALAPLFKQYEAEDVQELVDRIRTDPANFRDVAYKNGTTPEEEAAKEIIRLNKERNQAKKEAEANEKAEKERIEAVRKHVEALQGESVRVKELYPEFDFKAEMQDPSFEKLLSSGIPMLKAYRVLHIDDIVAKEVAKARKATNAAIEANMGRPSEVGAESMRGIKGDVDVNALTDEDIDDIMERVRRGERISFTP